MRCALFATTALSCFAGLAMTGAAAQGEQTNGARDVIVVTAQKRAQDIQDVPLAITAFSQEGLDRFGIQQFDDLADFVPGLEVQEQSANNPGFVIRGITSDSGDATIEPRIAIFQDGVPISRSRGSFVELYDSQVEVVRGPQPTLFGRSALIGAINVTSIKPELGVLEGRVRTGLGNEEFLFAEGAVNIPLGEHVAARISGRYKERDGYIDNLIGDDLNGFKTAAVRGSLRFQPTDKVDALLVVNYQRDDNPGTAFKSGTFLPSDENGVVPAGASILPWEAASLSTIPGGLGPNNGQDLGLERDVWGITGLVDWDLNDVFTLSSVTNYRKFDSAEVFDADGFALPMMALAENAKGEQLFQEIRLGFEGLGRFSGFFGMSVFDEEGSQNVPLYYDERVIIPAFTGSLYAQPRGTVQAPPLLSSLATTLGSTQLGIFAEEYTNFGESTSYDIFGDVTMEVTDRFDLTAGLRYTFDDRKSGYTAGLPGGAVPARAVGRPTRPGDGSAFFGTGQTLVNNVNSQNVPVFVEDEFDGFTYRVAGQYDISNDITVFANYGHGRRPEVIAYEASLFDNAVLAENFKTVEAEETDAYEIGLRGALFDGVLSGELVGYYYEYTNFQSTVVRDGRAVPENAGNASGPGFETAFAVRPAPWASYFFTYAYNGVEFDDKGTDGAPQLRAGNQFRLSPKHAFTAAAEFVWDCGCGTLKFVPSFTYRSEIFFDDNNDIAFDPNGDPNTQLQGATPLIRPGGDQFQDEVEPGYNIVDLRVRYTPNWDDTLEIEAFIENVFDEEYILDAGNTGDIFGIPTFISGVPQMYGVYLSKSF